MNGPASAPLAERYFERLDASKGKHLIWFENWEHSPQLEEPEKFCTVLVKEMSETDHNS